MKFFRNIEKDKFYTLEDKYAELGDRIHSKSYSREQIENSLKDEAKRMKERGKFDDYEKAEQALWLDLSEVAISKAEAIETMKKTITREKKLFL